MFNCFLSTEIIFLYILIIIPEKEGTQYPWGNNLVKYSVYIRNRRFKDKQGIHVCFSSV